MIMFHSIAYVDREITKVPGFPATWPKVSFSKSRKYFYIKTPNKLYNKPDYMRIVDYLPGNTENHVSFASKKIRVK